ncbi:uncharacterized protein EV420DRAFT_1688251 [Desarmillaria tabescens]|uniref:Uncharacterized protein n=1 Tax=Armillaria tabescens TaxID=1929756 RepID=A0AA39J0J9_ARMTA|nr:uncharacterized protein EV420DRAFT_1688251 [Desarmillaria tabescens]KAK0433911.1 hypothetical protein EV420DRAFT_1688251 [Desarmillaria tabescens]
MVHQDSSSNLEDVNQVLDVMLNPSPCCHPKLLSDTPILEFQTPVIDDQLASPSLDKGDKFPDYGIYESLGVEEISAFTETGKAESSIEVPWQRKYTSRKGKDDEGTQWEVTSSAPANIPCASLSIQGILDLLSTILQMSHMLDTPSVSILEDCITENYNFGITYSHLCQVWKNNNGGTMQYKLHRHEEEDQKR